MRSAFTNEVQTKGIIRVKYSNLNITAAIRAAVEAKNNNHWAPTFVSLVVILNLF
jgi:hypothetical protein